MKNWLRGIYIWVAIILSMCVSMPVLAEESYTLNVYYHNTAVDVTIDGATFDVVMVATRDGGNCRYTMIEPYSNADVDPNNVGDDVAGAANQLLELYETCASEVTTDGNGRSSMTIHTAGMYLIWQKSSTGTAAQYHTATPMLVYIPTINDDGATWNTNITIEPKTTKRDTGGGGDSGGGDGGDDSSGGASTIPVKKPDKVKEPEKLLETELEEVEGSEGSDGSDGSGAGDDEPGVGSIDGYGDFMAEYISGLISNGGFSGDSSKIRVYGAIAIFALIALAGLGLRRYMKRHEE